MTTFSIINEKLNGIKDLTNIIIKYKNEMEIEIEQHSRLLKEFSLITDFFEGYRNMNILPGVVSLILNDNYYENDTSDYYEIVFDNELEHI